jgi:hypothetical protein
LPYTISVRWCKQPSSGTTVLSGNDDASVALEYTPGYEQVYLNGVLLSKGNDYTATNGTSVTLLSATSTGDIVEVLCPKQISYADTYTQSQSTNLFVQRSNYPVAGKNKIINGDFGIWQRGTSFSGGMGYKADRMFSDVGVSNVISRSTDVPSGQGLTYSYKFVNTEVNCPIRHAVELPATGSLGVYQVGTTWTFSMWAKTSAPRTINLYAAFTIGNMGTPEATPVNAVPIGTTSTNWQRFTYTFTIPSGTSLTSANCFQITPFITGTGTGIDAFFAGMQLESGSGATSFSTSTGTIQGELAACQRYYYRSGVTPGNYQKFGTGYYTSTTQSQIFYPFVVPMRIAPNAFEYSTIGLYDGTNIIASTSAVLGDASTTGCTVVHSVSSGGVANKSIQSIANASSSAYMAFSAEL